MAAVEVGVVLAGGAGSRLGGEKAGARLHGRPLAAWVAAALADVVEEVVVVARAVTALPEVGCAVWREPRSSTGASPHPLAGLAFALSRSRGRGVLCCPVDLPFVTAGVLSALLAAGRGGVAVADGQPLLGRFPAACGPALGEAARAGGSVRAAVAALSPTVVPLEDPSVLFNVNTPEDLARARAAAAARARPPRR